MENKYSLKIIFFKDVIRFSFTFATTFMPAYSPLCTLFFNASPLHDFRAAFQLAFVMNLSLPPCEGAACQSVYISGVYI
jgi:hypothetical protein